MSKISVLYTKTKKENVSSDEEQTHEDIWDDELLINAYDKAVHIANAEIAKKIAMSTNDLYFEKNEMNHSETKHSKKKNKSSKKKSVDKPNSSSNKKWQAGMPCRVVYEEDGKEYEAYIQKMKSDKECVIVYTGYDDVDIVSVSALKPSLGQAAQLQQLKMAFHEKADDGFASQTTDDDHINENLLFSKRSRPNNKFPHFDSGFAMPDMFSMPKMNMPRNFPGMCMPPPPPMLPRRNDSDEQALSSMLLSWYMSGYYTGLYQALKSKDKK